VWAVVPVHCRGLLAGDPPANLLYTILIERGTHEAVDAVAPGGPRYTLRSEDPITTSNRFKVRAAIELSLLVALVLIELWLLRGMDDGRALAWVWLVIGAVYASSIRNRGFGEVREALRIAPLRPWLEAAGATAAVLLIVGVWVAVAAEPYDGLDLEPFRRSPLEVANWVSRRLMWAVWYQLLLHTFLWPNLRELVRSDRQATVASAALFGLLHLPVLALVAATTVCGWLWTVLFRRGRRLLPLILSHAILAGFSSVAVPPRVLHDRQVGAEALRTRAQYRVLASDQAREILRVVNSAEYYRAQGGTDRQWVAALYRDILGREPAAIEVDFWIQWKEIRGNRTVARHFVISDEFRALQDRYGDDYGFPFRRERLRGQPPAAVRGVEPPD
jgi:membrane protease YdiL (CAAX protease family)